MITIMIVFINLLFLKQLIIAEMSEFPILNKFEKEKRVIQLHLNWSYMGNSHILYLAFFV
jgi:hypothetical protein